MAGLANPSRKLRLHPFFLLDERNLPLRKCKISTKAGCVQYERKTMCCWSAPLLPVVGLRFNSELGCQSNEVEIQCKNTFNRESIDKSLAMYTYLS
jgi:hypothetical protein